MKWLSLIGSIQAYCLIFQVLLMSADINCLGIRLAMDPWCLFVALPNYTIHYQKYAEWRRIHVSRNNQDLALASED